MTKTHRGFRGKADRAIHEQHAEARALGFVRTDRRGMSSYLAQFQRKNPSGNTLVFKDDLRLCRQVDVTWIATNLSNSAMYRSDAYASPAAAYVVAELANWGRA